MGMTRGRIITRILGVAAMLLSLLYAGDYLSLRYRIRAARDPYGTVTVRHYYALHKSRNKTDFMFADPENQVCVRSLFPHFGYTPCWYLSRNSEQRVDFY